MSRKKNHLFLRGVFVLLEQLEPHQACSPLGALSVKKHPQRGHTLRAGVVELFRGWDEFLNSDTGSSGGCVGMNGTWGCKQGGTARFAGGGRALGIPQGRLGRWGHEGDCL